MNQADLAIALGYDPAGDDLPRVIASGRGAIARQMLAIAEHHGVAVQHDRALAELLRPLEVGSPIPLAAFPRGGDPGAPQPRRRCARCRAWRFSGTDDPETLGRRLARHRRALERSDHVDPKSFEELTTSIHRRLLEPLAAEVEPRALLILLDEAEALRRTAPQLASGR